MNLITKEGAKAVEEAIGFLSSQQPLKPYKFSEQLSKSAKFHVEDIGPKGLIQHESSDGTKANDRIGRYGKIIGGWGENLSFYSETALEVILSLIIDDGVANRGHRENIFKADHGFCGVYTGDHKSA